MSKANQAFKQNDEAVSPVIGVILMVAITVVLAAVVFVLVSNLGKGTDKAPTFSLTKDDNSDRLSVISADSDADWNRVQIRTGYATLKFNLGASATIAAGTVIVPNTNTEVTGAADPMGAGEFLSFCDTAATSAQVTVTLIDGAANSQVGEYIFQDVAACA